MSKLNTFRRFKATIGSIELGSSILDESWNSNGVLQQLTVDGCPLGSGNVTVVGWPGDKFKVVRQDGQEICFEKKEI